jgi:Domain of unknown function DUF29
MDELLELRSHIEHGRYPEALLLIGELEEMSYEDKVSKIKSFLQILLLHIIKQKAENRSTRSWEIAIRNAVREIHSTNKRRKTSGFYLRSDELQAVIDEAYEGALDFASLEAFEGRLDPEELAALIDEKAIKTEALCLVLNQ